MEDKEKKKLLDNAVKEMEKQGYRVLSKEEHRELVKDKKIVFSEQALSNLDKIVKEQKEKSIELRGRTKEVIKRAKRLFT